MKDLFGNPVKVKRRRKPRTEPTRAQLRVLRVASRFGYVRRRSRGAQGHGEVFERPMLVDRCIARGWLAAAESFNTYVPTEAAFDLLTPA